MASRYLLIADGITQKDATLLYHIETMTRWESLAESNCMCVSVSVATVSAGVGMFSMLDTDLLIHTLAGTLHETVLVLDEAEAELEYTDGVISLLRFSIQRHAQYWDSIIV